MREVLPHVAAHAGKTQALPGHDQNEACDVAQEQCGHQNHQDRWKRLPFVAPKSLGQEPHGQEKENPLETVRPDLDRVFIAPAAVDPSQNGPTRERDPQKGYGFVVAMEGDQKEDGDPQREQDRLRPGKPARPDHRQFELRHGATAKSDRAWARTAGSSGRPSMRDNSWMRPSCSRECTWEKVRPSRVDFSMERCRSASAATWCRWVMATTWRVLAKSRSADPPWWATVPESPASTSSNTRSGTGSTIAR